VMRFMPSVYRRAFGFAPAKLRACGPAGQERQRSGARSACGVFCEPAVPVRLFSGAGDNRLKGCKGEGNAASDGSEIPVAASLNLDPARR
jgi:hypothetical protein